MNFFTESVANITKGVHKHVTMLVALLIVFAAFLYAPTDCISAPLPIQNTAQVSFSVNGTPTQLSSNTVTTSVNPLVDVKTIAVAAQLDVIQADITGYTYSFNVTNTGNTNDQFDLSAGFTNIASPILALWIDKNRNNLFDPAIDAQIDTNGPGIPLNAGETMTVLVLAPASGTMRLTATSLNDDPLAVVYHRSASASIAPRVPLNINATRAATVTLAKSQIVDTQGATQPGPGAFITYSLVARVPASVGASNIRIHDIMPAGTSYIPGSLTLDAAPLSDAANDDAGSFDALGKSISVALPAPDSSQSTATVEHVVRFRVRIN